MPPPITLPFGLAPGGIGSLSSQSLRSSLPVLAHHFGIEPGAGLLPRFQGAVSNLLQRPEITRYLPADQIGHLASFMDLKEGEDERPLTDAEISALGTLHSLQSHYTSLGVSPAPEAEDAARMDVLASLRRTGPLLTENSIFAQLASLRPEGTPPQEASLMMAAGSSSLGDSRKTGEAASPLQASSPVGERISTPSPEKRIENRAIISQWVAARGGNPKQAIQRVLIVNNGMSATRLVKGIRSLSERIAIDQGLNAAEHHLIDVIGMASKSDLESKAKYLGEVDELVKFTTVEKAGDLFLDAERILKVAKDKGVDAIAVGWGFMAENAAFVKLATERGFNVIAPPHTAIEQLGGKIASKVLAEDVGVEVLPWTGGEVETAADAVRFARNNDYRIAIKADAGGGGKGIRLIEGKDDEHIDYQIWRDPLGSDVESRAQQRADLAHKLSNVPIGVIPSEEAFALMSETDQALWVQTLRLAMVLRKRREWLAGDEEEIVPAPASLSLIEEARAILGGQPEDLDRLIEMLILENFVADNFLSAANEAKISFKDPTVFIEILAPEDARHIEIQIDADQHGNVRALPERDCTGQRRRQKLFEEAPAIFVPEETRGEMREAGVKVAVKAGYANLGTCEFLYSPSLKKFWFMEMNTRIQVEHPVTEMLINKDLVELQLMRAMGIPMTEAEKKEFVGRYDFGRHVIAARINAQDPNKGFTPSPGEIDDFEPPADTTIRNYFSIGRKGKVSTTSDPQIGHEFARSERMDASQSPMALRLKACGDLRRALEDTVLEGKGLKTTIEFSIDVLGSPTFQTGEGFNIKTLDKVAKEYGDRALPVSGSVALMAAAMHRFQMELSQKEAAFQSDLDGGRPINRDYLSQAQTFDLPFAGRDYKVTVRKLENDLYAVTSDGVTREVEAVTKDGSVLTIGGKTHSVTVSGNDPLRIQIDGRNFEAAVNDPTKIKSFTAGSVWKIEIKEGQKVRPGDVLVVLESMKMEFPREAEIAGTVKKIHVEEKKGIDVGQLIVEIEPEGGKAVPTKVPEVIRLEAEENTVLHHADKLIEHVNKFPHERLQAVLVRILQGASYQTGKKAKGDKAPTIDGIILGRYTKEVEELQKKLGSVSEGALEAFIQSGAIPEVEGEEKTTLQEVQAMLLRLRQIVDLFVRDELPFSKTSNERAAYKAAGSQAFALALSHAQLETKTRLLLNTLELAKLLPYQAPLPDEGQKNGDQKMKSLVAALEPLSEFRTEVYREARTQALDMIGYAQPSGLEDSFRTEERILQAASLPPFSSRRNVLTDELIEAPILSANKILTLLDHDDYEVRCVAGYVLLRRTYARHRVVGDSFNLVRKDRSHPEYSTWHYQDGVTGRLRLGVAVNLSPQKGTLSQVLKDGAELLKAERRRLDPSRDTTNDTLEVIVSPGGLGDYQDVDDFLKSAREILERCFDQDAPKHVKFTIRHAEGRSMEYYQFRPTPEGGFQEDRRFRGMDPLEANLLEMQRWSDWELEKHINSDRSIHLWAVQRGQGDETDRRLTARSLVGSADVHPGPEGLSLPDFADTYQRAVQLLRRELDRYGPKERPPMNHLFFNILPVIHADFDAARGMIEAAIGKQMEERVSPLLKVEVLAKVRDKSARRGYRDVIFIVNQSGPIASSRAYVVCQLEGKNHLVDWDRYLEVDGDLNKLPIEDFKPMGTPYAMKTDLEKRRAARQAGGNFYVYDRPQVIQSELEAIWKAEGLVPPPDVFESTELVLKDGTLQKTDRGPLQNDRSMVAWHLKVRYPEDETPRDLIVLSSDMTHENGTISPKEGEFYNAVLDYAVQAGVPYGQILEGFGARMGLDPNLALPHREGNVEIPPPLQFDLKTQILYLTEEDYQKAPRVLDPGSKATKLGDLVEGEWIHLPSADSTGGKRVFRVDTVIGGVSGLNTENLAQGSGRMGGALERAYDQIPTMTAIVDTVVGILTYLARVGRRVIQVTRVPQLLTGNRALNKLYNRLVFATNREIGDCSVMLPNGVSQYGAKDERDSIKQLLQWFRYLPRRRGEAAPVKPGVSVEGRDVGKILLGEPGKAGIILDANGKVQAYDPRRVIETIFDPGEFREIAEQWGKVVVAGRTRIGGVPVGVITFDPRTQTLVIPADPTDPTHRERRVPQAGSVWHPDAAYKTAQMLFDFEREGLPKVILANVKGFPGGSFDMGPGQITKFGAMIVESLVRAGQGRRLLKPTIVVVLPFGELRGGADVVIDSYLNRESLVMLMDEHGEMSVLPREGMYEVPAIGDPFKEDNRWPG